MQIFRLKYQNQTLKDYCEGLRQEAALIQREIEKLEMKRSTLHDLSFRIESDFITEDDSAKVKPPIEKGSA